MDEQDRRLPISLFYDFSALPSGFEKGSTKTRTEIKTNVYIFMKDVDINTYILCKGQIFDLLPLKTKFKGGIEDKPRDIQLFINTKLKIKNDFFEELFRKYTIMNSKCLIYLVDV